MGGPVPLPADWQLWGESLGSFMDRTTSTMYIYIYMYKTYRNMIEPATCFLPLSLPCILGCYHQTSLCWTRSQSLKLVFIFLFCIPIFGSCLLNPHIPNLIVSMRCRDSPYHEPLCTSCQNAPDSSLESLPYHRSIDIKHIFLLVWAVQVHPQNPPFMVGFFPAVNLS